MTPKRNTDDRLSITFAINFAQLIFIYDRDLNKVLEKLIYQSMLYTMVTTKMYPKFKANTL